MLRVRGGGGEMKILSGKDESAPVDFSPRREFSLKGEHHTELS
jgi:hypothetical protein